MNRFLYSASFIFAGLLMLASCSKSLERNVEYTIYTTQSSLELIEGEEFQITASPTTQAFTYETTDAKVATVSTMGLVRAISDGTCFINITSSEGLSRQIPVDVEMLLLLQGINIFNKANLALVNSLSLLKGQTIDLGADAIPFNYNEKIPFNLIWESSDKEIVTIDERGIVRSVNFGNAEITVSVANKPFVKKVIPVKVL